MARRTLLGATAVLVAAAALAGCSVTTTSQSALASITASPTASAAPSGSAAPVLDLQLRPVVSAEPADPGECPPQPVPGTPAPRQTARLCSSDLTTVYELKPAAVTGESVEEITPAGTADGAVIQVRYDAKGGNALRTVTLAGSLEDPQTALAIVSHGRVLGAPTMSEEIDGGVLVISGFATLDQARSTLKFIAG